VPLVDELAAQAQMLGMVTEVNLFTVVVDAGGL
jgi:hypothetical protein